MQNLNYKRAFLHAIILWIATFVAGFIIGVISGISGNPLPVALLGASNFIVTAIGVLIIQLREKISWSHYGLIVLFLGLISLGNIFMVGTPLTAVIIGTVLLGIIGAIAKLIGGFIARS